MRWEGHVAHTGEMGNEYNILVGKPKGKRPLGRPKHKCEDNVTLNLKQTGCEFNWLGTGSCEHGNELSDSIKGGQFLD